MRSNTATYINIISLIVSIIFLIILVYAAGFFSSTEQTSGDPKVYEKARQILQRERCVDKRGDKLPLPKINSQENYSPAIKVIPLNCEAKSTDNFLQFRKFCEILQDNAQTNEFAEKIRLAQRENCLHKMRRYCEVLQDMYKQRINGPARQPINNISSTERLGQHIGMIEKVLQDVLTCYERLEENNAVRRIEIALREIVVDRQRGFASLVGRKKLKNFIAGQILAFARSPTLFNNNMQNMVLLGNSGIGKTHLARVLAFAYCRSGIIMRNCFVVGTKRDLVSTYVGETSHVAFSKLCETLESVYLIDEAYELGAQNIYLSGSKGHNPEAVTELVNFLDKFKGCNIVIAAGYEDAMNQHFFPANEGLARRFPHKLLLEPYSSQELSTILLWQIAEKSNDILRITNQEDVANLREIVATLHERDQDLRERQAGQIEIIAGYIVNHALSSDVRWDDGHNKELILGGVNSYLRNKGESYQLST